MFRSIITFSKCLFSTPKKNPFTVLGVPPSASEQQIKSAYFKLAKQYHPDIQPAFAEKFKEINEAYNILKDPAKKAEYSSSQNQQRKQETHYSNYDNFHKPYDNPYQQNNDFYYQQNPYRDSYRPRYRRFHRNYYGFDSPFSFEEMDQKARRQYRKSQMYQGFYYNDNYPPNNFTRIFLSLTLMLSFLFLCGSMMFSFYAYDRARRQRQRDRYQYIPIEQYDQEM